MIHVRKRLAILASGALVCMATVWCSIIVYAADKGGAEIPAGAKYIGSKKCRSCHLKQHKAWRTTKHYKTFDRLEDADKKDPNCLKCHTTGYGKPGGFVNEDDSPDLKGTGCEGCHGPGSAHAEAAKDAPEGKKWDDPAYPKVVATNCVSCHQPHVDEKARITELRAKRK